MISTQTAASSVVVMEWVCGGGLRHVPVGDIPSGLRAEGQAMMLALVQGLAAAGCHVRVPLDTRLVDAAAVQRLSPAVQVEAVRDVPPRDYLHVWCDVSQDCDCAWLVAPETDGVLCQAACALRRCGVRLLTADAAFLEAASDKRLTAAAWHTHHIPHPPCIGLDQINSRWVADHCPKNNDGGDTADARWIVKPADGAGCDGLQMITTQQLWSMRQAACPTATGDLAAAEAAAPSKLLVQPWVTGVAASCAAMIDAGGQAHWMPVVSQDFDTSASGRLHYRGSTLPLPHVTSGVPYELFNRCLGALPGTPRGWIGLDLVFEPQCQQWTIIEINPRCTSSLVGLAAAYQGNLVGDCWRLQQGTLEQLPGHFTAHRFRLPPTDSLHPVVQRQATEIHHQHR